MTDYIFELADSKTRERIGELTQARDRQLVMTLNKAGALTFNLPLADGLSLYVEEVVTCARIKRRLPDGSYKREWEGPIWTVEEETPNGLSIGCVGWLQTLDQRETKPAGTADFPSWTQLQYVEEDAGAVALSLLTQSNGDSSYGDTNYVVPGTAEITQPRTETFQPWTKLLTAIQGFSALESGFDMAVDPVTRELNIYRKLGSVLPDVRFEYGSNVIKARRTSDSSRICNRFIAYSAVGYAVAEDLSSQADIGLMEESLSLTGVVDVSILQAYANAEVAVRSRPIRLSSFDPRKASSARPEDPQVFRDLNVGDVVFESVDRGRLQVVKQAHRIFGMTVTWDVAGMPQISNMQTTAS